MASALRTLLVHEASMVSCSWLPALRKAPTIALLETPK